MRRIIFKLALSGGVALLTYLIVSLIENDFSGLSVTSAIFSFLVVLNIDILLQLVNISSKLRTVDMIDIIEPLLLRKYAKKLIDKHNDVFNELEKETIRFDSEGTMMQIYYDVMSNENYRKILATSMVDVRNVWKTMRGKRALDENKRLIRCGTKIERIFLFANEEKLRCDESQEAMRVQHDIGVEVSWTLTSHLSPELRRDFLVTDSNVTLEYKIDSAGNIVECIFSCNKKLAYRFKDKFRQIAHAAHPYSD